MAQNVSDNFIRIAKSAQKMTDFRVMISWGKNIKENAGFFQLDSSALDSGDILKGSSEVVALFDKYDYVDESKFVKNFEISRKVSNYAWGVITARAKITLNNRTGRFLLGGELGSNLAPGRPVKIMVGFGGEMTTIFTGFLGAPKINIVEGTVEFDAFDTMTFFGDKKANAQYYEGKNLREIIDALMSEQGFGLDQYKVGSDFNRRYPFFYMAGKNLLSIFDEVAQNETALISADENGILNFVRIKDLIRKTDRKWNFNYSNITELGISESNIINSVKVKSEYYRELGFGDVYELSQNTGQAMVIPAKSKRSFWLEYGSDVDFAVGVSVRESEFRTAASGGSVVGGITFSGYNLLDKYKIEVTNPTNAPAYITKLVLFGRIVNKFSETPVVITNAVSAEKYGVNPDSSTGFWGEPIEYDTSVYGTITEAGVVVKSNYDVMAEIGNAIISAHSSPNRQFRASNFLVPHLQVGDVVGLNVEDLGEDYDCVILGATIKGGVDANFRQELFLQIIPEVNYFVLDSSRLDGGDVLV